MLGVEIGAAGCMAAQPDWHYVTVGVSGDFFGYSAGNFGSISNPRTQNRDIGTIMFFDTGNETRLMLVTIAGDLPQNFWRKLEWQRTDGTFASITSGEMGRLFANGFTQWARQGFPDNADFWTQADVGQRRIIRFL